MEFVEGVDLDLPKRLQNLRLWYLETQVHLTT